MNYEQSIQTEQNRFIKLKEHQSLNEEPNTPSDNVRDGLG